MNMNSCKSKSYTLILQIPCTWNFLNIFLHVYLLGFWHYLLQEEYITTLRQANPAFHDHVLNSVEKFWPVLHETSHSSNCNTLPQCSSTHFKLSAHWRHAPEWILARAFPTYLSVQKIQTAMCHSVAAWRVQKLFDLTTISSQFFQKAFPEWASNSNC
jgi:hypothetical protein